VLAIRFLKERDFGNQKFDKKKSKIYQELFHLRIKLKFS